MTTYKEIFGKAVKFLSTDPTDDIEGQIWYNSTSGTFKTQELVAAAWASGGNMGTARSQGGSAGTQTAAISFMGAPGPVGLSSESYNGTSWTSTPNVNTFRYGIGGVGTQTAALGFGGYVPGSATSNATEEWNGSSWTTQNTLPTATYGIAGAGIQTAALGFGGSPGSAGTPVITTTRTYNGTSWTDVPATLNTGRSQLSGSGTQTAALAMAGLNPPGFVNVESYNGSTWTTITSLNTGRINGGAAGTQTSSIIFGGQTPPSLTRTSATEIWNGTSWTTSSNMATASLNSGAGTASSALASILNGPGGAIVNTEEFTGNTLTTKTITTS
jgi:hypothetical protein